MRGQSMVRAVAAGGHCRCHPVFLQCVRVRVRIGVLPSHPHTRRHRNKMTSLGVSSGVALGVLKIVYTIDLMHVLLPLYILACVMTLFSREEVVCVAWDSAGVTTSEVAG